MGQRERFIAGEHYVLLDKPVPTRDSSKVEVVQAFSYGCPPCYGIELLITHWIEQQGSGVDFWRFPAVWNEPMKLYAKAYFTAQELNVLKKIHRPLFTAIVIDQEKISNESELSDFFAEFGVDRRIFVRTFNSPSIESQVDEAETRVRSYNLASAPEFVVNGKFRVDRMRAGGLAEMLAVVDFLVDKEHNMLRR